MIWYRLPPEIRLHILYFVVTGSAYDKVSYGLSVFSPVCKEWQMVFENETFKALKITQKSLPKLDQVFQNSFRRQSCLESLWLRVELPRYRQPRRPRLQTLAEEDACSQEFSDALANLFLVLAKWDAKHVLNTAHGISLELSAYCESDAGNMCGPDGLMPDGSDRCLDLEIDDFRETDDERGIFGLPRVSLITKLSILKRNHRRIGEDTVFRMAQSLPNLKRVHLEPWHRADFDSQRMADYSMDSSPTTRSQRFSNVV